MILNPQTYGRGLVAGAVVASLLLAGCQGTTVERGAPLAPTTAPASQTFQVKRAPVAEYVSGVGRIAAERESALAFQTGGRVRQVTAVAGQPVKKGDVLAELDLGSLLVQMEISRINLQVAELREVQLLGKPDGEKLLELARQLASAQLSYSQTLTASQRGASVDQRAIDAASASVQGARAAYDRAIVEARKNAPATIEVTIAQLSVESARLALHAIEAQVEMGRLRAPFDGVVSEFSIREGDQIGPNSRFGLISDPRTLQVAVEVAGDDLAKLSLGQPATIKVGQNGQELTGQVASLPAARAAAPGQLGAAAKGEIRVGLAPGQTLDLGLVAQMSVLTQRKDQALVIPAEAIRKLGSRKLVYIQLEDGRRSEVEIETGVATDTLVEVVRGLSEGQTIALP